MSSDRALSPAPAATATATVALERSLDETLEVFGNLTAEELAAPSACDGWTVHMILAHLTISVANIAGLLPFTPYDQEREFEAELDEHARRVAGRPAAELLDLYQASVPAVLATYGGLSGDLATMPVSLGSAGTYPLASIADALVFDNTCHIRWDVLAPRGPIQRVLPDLDAERVRAANRWLIGGIPQMTTERFRELLTDPVAFVFTGPGGATIRLLPHATATESFDDATAAQDGARATVRTNAADFILWGTGREPRDTLVEITGDIGYANTILDVFRVY